MPHLRSKLAVDLVGDHDQATGLLIAPGQPGTEQPVQRPVAGRQPPPGQVGVKLFVGQAQGRHLVEQIQVDATFLDAEQLAGRAAGYFLGPGARRCGNGRRGSRVRPRRAGAGQSSGGIDDALPAGRPGSFGTGLFGTVIRVW